MVKEGIIDLGNEVTIYPATEEDFAKLNADMRDADRKECQVFGADGDDLKYWHKAYVYCYKGEMLGIAGWTNFRDVSEMVRFRLIIMITMNSVNRHKFAYVKYSKVVTKYLVGTMPSWVTDLYSLPMSEYKQSIMWQERIIGMKKTGTLVINGVEHTVMHIRKEEV